VNMIRLLTSKHTFVKNGANTPKCGHLHNTRMVPKNGEENNFVWVIMHNLP
jgi:hypothetical protein